MAFLINSDTVINNSRKGIFQTTNPGSYTNATRPSNPSAGDIIYNSEEGNLQYYSGSIWKSCYFR